MITYDSLTTRRFFNGICTMGCLTVIIFFSIFKTINAYLTFIMMFLILLINFLGDYLIRKRGGII